MQSAGRDLDEKEILQKENISTSTSTRQTIQGQDDDVYRLKLAKISDACVWKDVDALRTLAASKGGFVSDEVRRQACSCYQQSFVELGLIPQ